MRSSRAVFNFIHDVGLLAEGVDPATGGRALSADEFAPFLWRSVISSDRFVLGKGRSVGGARL